MTSLEQPHDSMQQDLTDAITAASAAFDSNGELPLAARRRIRELLGSDWSTAEISAARHVLPIWTSAHSATLPMELLQLAERAKDEAQVRAALEDAAWRFEPVLEDALNSASPGGPFAPAMAGYAASAASHAVLGNLPVSVEDSELHFDPLDWDASFYASVAWAGGAPWEPVGQPARRRDFWTWFLTEAVPAAAEGRVID